MIKRLWIKVTNNATPSWLWWEITRRLVEIWTDTEANIADYDKVKVIWTSWAGKSQTAIRYVISNLDNISKVFYFTSYNNDITSGQLKEISSKIKFTQINYRDYSNLQNNYTINTEKLFIDIQKVLETFWNDIEISNLSEDWKYVEFNWKKFRKKLVPKDSRVIISKQTVFIFDEIHEINKQGELNKLIEFARPSKRSNNVKYILLEQWRP